MPRNWVRILFVFVCVSLGNFTEAFAAKFVVSGGAFQFSAENASNRVSRSISGFGSYQVGYRYIVNQNWEIDLGYSLLATQTFGGDISFGFDLGANYFPMTGAGSIRAEGDAAAIVLNDRWRPFLGLGFSQRNFQSTNSQFAGFGLKLGTEYQLDERFAVHGTVRYLMLNGPSQSSATQIDILSGLIVQF
jgi:hypothetical protein